MVLKLPGQAALEILAVEELHDDVRGVAVDPVVVDLHDVRDVKRLQQLGFGAEEIAPWRVGAVL